jgi:hypothetical protein
VLHTQWNFGDAASISIHHDIVNRAAMHNQVSQKEPAACSCSQLWQQRMQAERRVPITALVILLYIRMWSAMLRPMRNAEHSGDTATIAHVSKLRVLSTRRPFQSHKPSGSSFLPRWTVA